MTTAFVLTGGASLGAVQVGMLRALAEAGVAPDVLTGASVGALNAAWVATHGWPNGVDGLDRLWRSLRRTDVFPLGPASAVAGLLGRRNHLIDGSNLARVIGGNLPVATFADARLPLHVVTTEVTTGLEVTISEGDLLPALLASAAIPGVFEPVTVRGHELMDGGVADNAPLSVAAALGVTEAWVVPTGYACALPRPPRHPLAMVLHTFSLLVQQRLIHDVGRYQSELRLHVVPPLCPLSVSPMDFSRAAELIDRSYAATGAWLANGAEPPDQRDVLGLHRH